MKSIFFGLVGLLLSSTTIAQSLLDPLDIQVIIEPTNDVIIADNVADTLTDILDLMSDSDPMNVIVSLNVQDTINIVSINLKLGRNPGSNDIIDNSYTFDNNSPGGSLSFEREGLIVTLGTGSHINVETLFYEIHFEGANGNTSQVITGSTE